MRTHRGLLPLLALLAGWQLMGDTASIAFPPPAEWFSSLAELHADGVLLAALAETMSTYLLGLLVAVIAGALTGAVIGSSRHVDRALTPSLDFIATVPGAALVPVAVLLLGTSRLTSVLTVAFAVVWPILLNAVTATRAIPAVRLETARTLGFSPVARWRKFVLPSLAPAIMLGTRVASSIAMIVALLVDIFGTGHGIGRLLVERQQNLDAPAVWGLLLLVGTFGHLTATVLARVEAHLLRNLQRSSQ
ncbi:ABC transporter permease [Lentzea kentuckyensis]|uniref:ABC transporter permease n=1 Tax=Lentzea kentuckyensis TaxID=360086 RepID=UPI000A3D2FA2|nr:ABC transporter permease subunit [Lentzea kentuckyensis]